MTFVRRALIAAAIVAVPVVVLAQAMPAMNHRMGDANPEADMHQHMMGMHAAMMSAMMGGQTTMPTMDMAQAMPGMGAAPGAALPVTDARSAFMAANQRMMTGMNVVLTGEADRDFAAMMIPHHQGAIEMAQIELQYGKDPALRTLAEAIVKAQQDEIALMKKWQQDHAR